MKTGLACFGVLFDPAYLYAHVPKFCEPVCMHAWVCGYIDLGGDPLVERCLPSNLAGFQLGLVSEGREHCQQYLLILQSVVMLVSFNNSTRELNLKYLVFFFFRN